jgi:hypothetical protein
MSYETDFKTYATEAATSGIVVSTSGWVPKWPEIHVRSFCGDFYVFMNSATGFLTFIPLR